MGLILSSSLFISLLPLGQVTSSSSFWQRQEEERKLARMMSCFHCGFMLSSCFCNTAIDFLLNIHVPTSRWYLAVHRRPGLRLVTPCPWTQVSGEPAALLRQNDTTRMFTFTPPTTSHYGWEVLEIPADTVVYWPQFQLIHLPPPEETFLCSERCHSPATLSCTGEMDAALIRLQLNQRCTLSL